MITTMKDIIAAIVDSIAVIIVVYKIFLKLLKPGG